MGLSLSQRSDLIGHNDQICLDRGSNGQTRSSRPMHYKYYWERELSRCGSSFLLPTLLSPYLERKGVRVPPLLFLSHGFELRFLGEIESPLWVWMRG